MFKESDMNGVKAVFNPEAIRRIEKRLEEIIFDRQDEAILHNPFEWAQELFSYVISLDAEGLKRRLEYGVQMPGYPGELSEDKLRNNKTLTNAMMSALAYEVIDKGLLDAETAYSIADAVIQLVEGSESLEQIADNACAAFFVYIHEAGKRRRDYHPFVKGVKDYVFAHLHEKIAVTEMAEALGTSQSYLSRVFKEKEGVTIQRYIMDEKVRRSCNLLKFSDLPLRQISSSLAFANQSHFGKEFKKRMGTTPQNYRDANRTV